MHLNSICCQREKQLQVERNRWYCQQIFHLSHIILVSDWWSAADQSEGCIAPGLTNQRRGVGETFHLSQLQTVFCGFSIFSVLKQINVDRNMKNILSPRQIRCISMCSSLFLKNVPIPVWARGWWEGVGAVGRVPAVVYSLYCPLLKLAFCTDLRCDDLLMGEDWDDDGKQTSTFRDTRQLLATGEMLICWFNYWEFLLNPHHFLSGFSCQSPVFPPADESSSPPSPRAALLEILPGIKIYTSQKSVWTEVLTKLRYFLLTRVRSCCVFNSKELSNVHWGIGSWKESPFLGINPW